MTASTALLFALGTANCGSDDPGIPVQPQDTKPPASVGHALVFHEARGKVLLLNAGLGDP